MMFLRGKNSGDLCIIWERGDKLFYRFIPNKIKDFTEYNRSKLGKTKTENELYNDIKYAFLNLGNGEYYI